MDWTEGGVLQGLNPEKHSGEVMGQAAKLDVCRHLPVPCMGPFVPQ